MAVALLAAVLSGCVLYEDGSFRLPDGQTGCLLPELGCIDPPTTGGGWTKPLTDPTTPKAEA